MVRDLAVINVSIVDAQGRPVPTAGNKVAFVCGEWTREALLGVGNGDPTCHEPDKASERSAFNGLCMAIVQSNRGEAGAITVTVTSGGLEGATVSVTSCRRER